jgi:ATP/maltotriose-dependent transcriptional regulator MalT/DNA-binding SARP family transcriptional activator
VRDVDAPTPAQSRASKLATPSSRAALLRRPSLERILDDVFGRRLTFVVAGAGFGKSSLIAAWVVDVEHAWYTITGSDRELGSLARGIAASLRRSVPHAGELGAEGPAGAAALAAQICEALYERLDHDLVLVLDDVHELHGAPASVQLVENLCRQAPPTLHLLLVSRAEAPFPIDRLRGQGSVLELTGGMLAFDEDELAELVARATGAADPELVRLLADATEGWPAAVTLALDALQRVPADERADVLTRLGRPGGELFAYLAREALGRDPPELREVLRRASSFDHVPVELCTALGVDDAATALAGLARRGLATQLGSGEFVLHALVREFVRRTWPLDDTEARDLQRAAGAWFAARGDVEDALRSYAAAGELDASARLIVDQGPALLAAGSAAAVLRATDLLPTEHRNAAVEQVAGEALAALGRFTEALESFRRAAAGAERLDSALAWRMVRAHHLKGDLEQAVHEYERCAPVAGASRDDALLLAWAAASYTRRGQIDTGESLAVRALAGAEETDDAGALAAAHTALALVAETHGEFRLADFHQRRALVAAERANDLLQLSRARNNRGSVLLQQALYGEAVAELDEAISLAELVDFPPLLGLALMNRGLCHWCVGRLDHANADYAAAAGVFRSAGASEISYALIGRGDVYRERGDQSRARRLYEEGLAIAERAGDLQGIVPGLYQLAKVLVDDEPDRAAALAEQAVEHGWPDRAWALNALGWVALARGDAQTAANAARRAEEAARALDDRFGLAESLELHAFADTAALDRPQLLEDALEIWRELGNPIRSAAVELAAARLQGGVAAQAAAQRAERSLAELGVRVSPSGPAGLLRTVAIETEAPVAIDALGGFRVRRGGAPVPGAEWRSKKARDLLKLLVARNGAPTPRERLMDALWPGEDPSALGNRLSVALSTVRLVLDPERRFDPDHFVAGDADAVRLRPENLAVDVRIFLHHAAEGLRIVHEGRVDEAAPSLEAAEAAYTGDFLEADLYEDWAAPVREEAVAAYVEVVRALARRAAGAADHDVAVRLYLRLLERDPYDEPAHLELVAALGKARRLGEALRRYRIYCALMGELGVEAAPFAV